MWKHVASNALTFFVVVLFLLAGVVTWGAKQYSAPGPLANSICLEVVSGTNMRAVSKDLEAQGAVSSGAIFRIGADYSDKADSLKAGSYLVPAGAAMDQIVDIVTRGGASTCGTEVVYRIGVAGSQVQVRELDPATSRFVTLAEFDPAVTAPPEYATVKERADTRYRIVVAEGVTSWQVMTTLNGIDTLEGDIADLPAEGTLAPDSYEFTTGTPIADLMAQMIARQEAILAELWAQRSEFAPVNSPEEALILASIIEKETGVADERGLVASVFANRLDRGMPLQTDPTVIYGVTEGRGVLGRGLRQSELRTETPWNTYLIIGLPPTPIANPGRASIEAALNPQVTDYVFFVADGTGGHAFAETLEEHNLNVSRWREIEAQRAAEAAEAEADSSGN